MLLYKVFSLSFDWLLYLLYLVKRGIVDFYPTCCEEYLLVEGEN